MAGSVRVIPDVCCKWCGGALTRCYVQHQGDPPDPEGWHPIHARPRDHDCEMVAVADFVPPPSLDEVMEAHAKHLRSADGARAALESMPLREAP